MNRSASLVILAVALFMGVSAALLARQWVVRHAATPTAAVPMTTILVATAELPFGTQLTADNLSQIPWPSESVPEGAFASDASLLKDGPRLVLSPFVRGEPIVASRVTQPNQPASLSTIIEKGKRAVTVSIDEVRGVAGFVSPGDYVDVVLTPDRGSGNYTEVILQRVKVLAIDQQTDRREEKGVIARAVTFELSTEDSLKIVLATNIGRLSLILRQTWETASAPEARVTEQDLFADKTAPVATAAAAPEPAAPQPAQPASRQVAIYRDMKAQTYDVPVVAPSAGEPAAASVKPAAANARDARRELETKLTRGGYVASR